MSRLLYFCLTAGLLMMLVMPCINLYAATPQSPPVARTPSPPIKPQSPQPNPTKKKKKDKKKSPASPKPPEGNGDGKTKPPEGSTDTPKGK